MKSTMRILSVLVLGLALAAPASLLAQAVNVTGEWAFNVQTDQGGGTPTLLTGVRSGMRILEEETFGPVAPIVGFTYTTRPIIAEGTLELLRATSVATALLAALKANADKDEYLEKARWLCFL